VWYTIISEIAAIPSKTEVLHMTNYNTLGYNFKRSIFNFCNKLSKGFHRPIQKFIFEMVFGLVSAKSCLFTPRYRGNSMKILLWIKLWRDCRATWWALMVRKD